MADRTGPLYEGRQGPGGRNRYDYGVPSDGDGNPFARPGPVPNGASGADNYGGNGYGRNGYGANGASSPNGSYGGNGYSGEYDYSEPFDYFGTSAGAAPPPYSPAAAGSAVTTRAPGAVGPSPGYDQPPGPMPPNLTGETMPLGVVNARAATLAGRETRDERLGIPTGPSGGRAERRRAATRAKRRRRLSITKEIPILVVVALAIALVLKTFLVQAFVIPSGSMENTIRVGDRVLVDKLTPWFGTKAQRGDVVVFKDPGGWLPPGEQRQEDPVGIKQGKQFLTFIGLLPSDSEQDLIKRVVGVGGDKVKCCDANGKVTVNGKAIEEPYLFPGNKPSESKFDITVPNGRVFVLGDHRSRSADSRYHLNDKGDGAVPEEMVVGRAVVIAWPFDHWGKLEETDAFSSVPQAAGGATPQQAAGDNRVTQYPIPAELPLVMGVVGLSRLSGRRQWILRSDCGGLGGRRSFRFRRGGERGRWWTGGQAS